MNRYWIPGVGHVVEYPDPPLEGASRSVRLVLESTVPPPPPNRLKWLSALLGCLVGVYLTVGMGA